MEVSIMLEKLYEKLNGFHPGGLYFIAGIPAVGKSTLMLNIALDYAQKFNRKVLIFTIEMSKEEIAERFHYITGGSPKIVDLSIYIDDDFELTPDKIKVKIDSVKPDIVFIDYFQLMDVDIKYYPQSRQHELSDIIYRLKRIAKSNNVPVVILSQLSRNQNKRPSFEHMRYIDDVKSQIRRNLDVIMFLYNSDISSRHNKGVFDIEIIVSKNRYGESFIINSHLYCSTLRYMVCEDE